MHKNFGLWALVFSLWSLVLLAGCGKPAAIVNGESITHQQLDKELEKRYGKEVVSDLINKALVLQEARKENISVTPQEIKTRAEKLMESPKVKVVMQERGVTLKDLEDNYAFVIPLDKLVLKSVTDKEKRAFYEINKDKLAKVKAQHILLKDESTAKTVLAELKSGKDFSELAKKYSEDKVTGPKGGDLGAFYYDEMEEAFAKAAFDLKPGEISDIVHTKYGYHIIKAIKILNTYEDAEEEIAMALADPKRLEYVEGLRKKAKIKILL
jgi:foldase protein PrsA